MIAPQYRFLAYIEEPVSNNAFDYDQRKKENPNPQIFRASLIDGDLKDLAIGDRIAFESTNDKNEIIPCRGLKHFILMKNPLSKSPSHIYIFDNHNHAFYFWHQERLLGNISPHSTLVHVDQHRDTRIPAHFLHQDDYNNLEEIYRYTNSMLNVGNFIPAGVKSEVIKDVIFLDSQKSFEDFKIADYQKLSAEKKLILDIDIDVFAPELDFIDNQLKLKAIQELLPLANAVTIATSPFFIDQQLALEWIKKIFQSK
ncbi:MAG: UPF0489 family protein [Candidatus Altimarinota bacterium]